MRTIRTQTISFPDVPGSPVFRPTFAGWTGKFGETKITLRHNQISDEWLFVEDLQEGTIYDSLSAAASAAADQVFGERFV